MNTTILEGPIEHHKSWLASRETGEGLTGTHSGGSLDRTESVPKWSRKRRACTGLREASQRDKAMRSMPPFPAENDSVRFFIIAWLLSCLQSTTVVLFKLCDAGSLIRSFGMDIKSKLKIMSLEVDSTCHTECSHQYIHTTVTQAFGSMSPKNKKIELLL